MPHRSAQVRQAGSASIPAYQAPAGACGRIDRRRRHRRLEIDDDDGRAIVEASDICIETANRSPGHVLEAAAAAISVSAPAGCHCRHRPVGRDHGTGSCRSVPGWNLPPEVPTDRRIQHQRRPALGLPERLPIAEVEIDRIPVLSMSYATAFGQRCRLWVINPLLVDGQAHGGIVQGIGQALRERVVYAMTAVVDRLVSWITQCRGRRCAVLRQRQHPVPATTRPPAPRAAARRGVPARCRRVMNALVRRTAEFGIRHIDMPATPERVWRA